MSNVIDGSSLFRNNSSEGAKRTLQDRFEFYRNFLLLYEGISSYSNYYLTFHRGLTSSESFISIYCPHCGYIIDDSTMSNHKVWVHGKATAGDDLDDTSDWGILELVCPDCKKKTVVILE
ncbi:hypothetical protein ACSW8S_19870 (plasmid) [Clostridium perfringens]